MACRDREGNIVTEDDTQDKILKNYMKLNPDAAY